MKTVSTIVSLGIVPSTLEIMDDLTIKTVEDYKHLGLPLDVEALLLIEVDGDEELVAKEVRFIEEVCKKCNGKGVRAAKNNIESEALWEARRSAYPSLSRAKPVVISEDIVVPRTKLVEVMKGIKEISKNTKIPIATFSMQEMEIYILICLQMKTMKIWKMQ